MIGKTISHYRILEKIGEGGMGVVYKAEDTRLRRTIALKFLRPQTFANDEHRDRFVREAQTAAALDHPNICTIYEIDEAGGDLFIAMAYIEGPSLKNRIRSGPFDIDETLRVTAAIALGLEAAHRHGVIHRDIKSANILLTPEGLVKIMDFGLARTFGGDEISKTTRGVGTAAYMSPEQGRGDPVDHRTDIWSLGVVMYEMLTGELPFKGDYDPAVVYSLLNEDPVPVGELRPDLPLKAQRIIERAMAKDPDLRYQSAADILADLQSPDDAVDLAGSPVAPTLARRSIAVLPFSDLSPQKDQDYFCDGIAEEIINALTKIDGVRVAARTSSFSFKNKNEDVRRIGRKLNVETVLEGSVRKAGKRVRITGQLISVTNGYHLWSDRYDRELEDIFAIQEEIAGNIVRALRVELSDKERRAIERVPTRDVVAYDYYLRGRTFFYRSTRSGIESASEMFSSAIQKDPGYALAYAGLADCYSYLCLYFGGRGGHREKAQEASHKALELDPNLAEAHASRGLALSLSKKYADAEREFETATLLNPMLFEAYYFYARTCFAQGKFEKAIEMYHRAGEVNPEDYQAASLEAFTYRTMKRMDEAKGIYRRSLEAIEKHLELNPNDSRAIFLGATALIDLGQKERALHWVQRAEAIDPDDSYLTYGMACFYSRIGDADEAIRYLEKALEVGFAHKEWIEHDSDFDPIRDDPRFKALVDGMR
jgi:non-specific serine/threonine protein kinase